MISWNLEALLPKYVCNWFTCWFTNRMRIHLTINGHFLMIIAFKPSVSEPRVAQKDAIWLANGIYFHILNTHIVFNATCKPVAYFGKSSKFQPIIWPCLNYQAMGLDTGFKNQSYLLARATSIIFVCWTKSERTHVDGRDGWSHMTDSDRCASWMYHRPRYLSDYLRG